MHPLTPHNSQRMAVSRLRLSHFRNYEDRVFETQGACTVLVGANGIGKTNVLEAISLLMPGRGLRSANYRDMAKNEAGWSIAASIEGRFGPVQLGTRFTPQHEEENQRARRELRIEGAPARSQDDFAQHFSCLWLTPLQDTLFLEGDSARRRFFDHLIASLWPHHASAVNAYDQARRERGRLLSPDMARKADPAWISSVEKTMAELSVALAATRRDGLAQLQQALQLANPLFPAPILAMRGDAEDRLAAGEPALSVEMALIEAFYANRGQDSASGRASTGAHKTRWQVRHSTHFRDAETCSTGEQKALLLSLTMAQARACALGAGALPVLLLDEVVAHLDAHRRIALFSELENLGAQAWLTGTDLALFSTRRDAKNWNIVELE